MEVLMVKLYDVGYSWNHASLCSHRFKSYL